MKRKRTLKRFVPQTQIEFEACNSPMGQLIQILMDDTEKCINLPRKAKKKMWKKLNDRVENIIAPLLLLMIKDYRKHLNLPDDPELNKSLEEINFEIINFTV